MMSNSAGRALGAVPTLMVVTLKLRILQYLQLDAVDWDGWGSLKKLE
jgi:hypothetical protein